MKPGVTTGCLSSAPSVPGGLAVANDLRCSLAGPRLDAAPGPVAPAPRMADTVSWPAETTFLGIVYCRLKPVIRIGYATPLAVPTGTVSVCGRPSAGRRT